MIIGNHNVIRFFNRGLHAFSLFENVVIECVAEIGVVKVVIEAVLYTHLKLPENREV